MATKTVTSREKVMPAIRMARYRAFQKALSTAKALKLGRRFPGLRSVLWKVQPAMRPNQLKIDGEWFELHPHDVAVTHALFQDGVYEPTITGLLKNTVKGPEVFIDIGANIGYYTTLVGRRLTSGRVLAIEPDRLNAEILARNVARSDAVRSCTTVQTVALDAAPGTISIYLNDENRGDHRTYYVEGREHYTVDAVRLDALLRDLGLVPDIIKIDIQGSELKALRGAGDELARRESLLLITEFWPMGISSAGDDPIDYAQLLVGAGFEFFAVGADQLHHASSAKVLEMAGDQATDMDLVCAKGAWRDRLASFIDSRQPR